MSSIIVNDGDMKLLVELIQRALNIQRIKHTVEDVPSYFYQKDILLFEDFSNKFFEKPKIAPTLRLEILLAEPADLIVDTKYCGRTDVIQVSVLNFPLDTKICLDSYLMPRDKDYSLSSHPEFTNFLKLVGALAKELTSFYYNFLYRITNFASDIKEWCLEKGYHVGLHQVQDKILLEVFHPAKSETIALLELKYNRILWYKGRTTLFETSYALTQVTSELKQLAEKLKV